MKKSKKFVLAGLALLAITGLLALAGCKNDTVPPEVEKQEQGDGGGSETDKNNTAAKLVSISVTPPARTVYNVGDEVDHKKDEKIEVTATYDDGEERRVTGTITTDTSTLTESAGIGKPVTVSYTEGDTRKEATFTVDVASYQFTETVQNVDSSYTGTMTDGDYKKFGDWPQTIKDENVTVGKNTMTRGGMDFHVGSDGNYYVEQKENANGSGTAYLYSNGEPAGQGGTSTKWFKVEPIVWRVLTTNYEVPKGGTGGNALLLAEKILTGGIKWADSSNNYNYKESYIRQWLNGNSGTGETSDYGDAGFLQTAFTEFAQDLIELTTVDNSAASTTDAGNNLTQADGCSDTTDKIFLLSEEEATTSEYGFAEYNVYVGDNDDTTTSTRIRVTTDYAKATGAYQGNSSAGYGGWWWLRSLCYDFVNCARNILINGNAKDGMLMVTSTIGGVVPALSISLGEN